MSEHDIAVSANGQRRTNFKPKPTSIARHVFLMNRVAHATRRLIILCERGKSFCCPRAAYDEILEGGRRSKSTVSVGGQCLRDLRDLRPPRDPWLARNRHRISRFPADSLPLSTWPVLNFRSGEGVPPPPPPAIHTLSILFLKNGLQLSTIGARIALH